MGAETSKRHITATIVEHAVYPMVNNQKDFNMNNPFALPTTSNVLSAISKAVGGLENVATAQFTEAATQSDKIDKATFKRRAALREANKAERVLKKLNDLLS